MDKQRAADLLEEQLLKIPLLKELSPDHPDFQLWREDCLTIFEQYFSGDKRFLDAFDEWQFLPHVIKHVDDGYTQMDQEAYERGLQGGEVIIKAALRKLELFGIKPQIKGEVSNEDNSKDQRFGDITVSGGTLILGDGNKITQVAVKELVEALEEEIREKVSDSEEKKSVLSSLKSITTNETFASIAGTVIGEILRRVTRP